LALALPMLLIAIPWFVLISSSQHDFSSHFFWTHHIQRFLNAFNHSEPWWFYLPVLVLELLPASLLLPAMAVYLFARGKEFRRHGERGEPRGTMRTRQLGTLLIAAVWVVTFFSISSCKLPAYILPAIPMFCLALGKMLQDVQWSSHTIPALQSYTRRALGQAVLLTSCVAVVAVVGDLVFHPSATMGISLAFLFIPGLAWLVWKVGENRSTRNAWVAAVTLCLVVSVYSFDRVVPRIASWRSLTHTAATLRQQLGPRVPVVYFGQSPHSATFSIPRSEVAVFTAGQIDGFRHFMDQHAVAVVVTDHHDADRIRADCGQSVNLQGPEARGRVYVAKSTVSTGLHVGQRLGRNLK